MALRICSSEHWQGCDRDVARTVALTPGRFLVSQLQGDGIGVAATGALAVVPTAARPVCAGLRR
jgi:hypothetical protein